MTRADVLRMARDAGLSVTPPRSGQYDGGRIGGDVVALERFAVLVAAAEREECAKVCDIVTARYLLCPGPVRSRVDGDRHHVSPAQLANLYGVPMAECVVMPLQRPEFHRARMALLEGGHWLMPVHPYRPKKSKAPAPEVTQWQVKGTEAQSLSDALGRNAQQHTWTALTLDADQIATLRGLGFILTGGPATP